MRVGEWVSEALSVSVFISVEVLVQSNAHQFNDISLVWQEEMFNPLICSMLV